MDVLATFYILFFILLIKSISVECELCFLADSQESRFV